MNHTESLAVLTKLAHNYDEMKELVGHILATLALNLDRGSLTFRSEVNDDEFRRWLKKWHSEWEQCKCK